jgi:gliding motility-associated-like protein
MNIRSYLPILLGMLVFSNLKAQVNLATGLVAHYSFNGTPNDVSGNGHHGQLVNGVQLAVDRFGNPNSAYAFDGINDYIRILDNGAFSTPKFSLVIWFQTQSDNLQCLVGKRHFSTMSGTGGGQYQFFINYPPFPGIGSNIVGNTSTCTSISSSSYMSTTDWICRSKWYCAVVTFDGTTHKIFIDGVLKKALPTNFNAFLSCNSDLRLGNWWQSDLQSYKGIMDDVRWYNRALNQDEVTALYDNFPIISGQCSSNAGAGFLTPDTVCVNAPVTIANTSVGASSYYWNFCVANSASNPVGTNLGNFGFSLPGFIDYGKEGNNYYGFVTNSIPGKLIRLDFGNSLLNTPTYFDMGNLGGAIPEQCEGIQVVKNQGRWYAIVVGGQPVGRIVKVDFGTSLSNNSPVATNWGNVGNLAYPTDLHIFQDGLNWYGLTINAQNNTITRFNFTASFNSTPTGVNLGNIGNLDYPTGIYAINNNGSWHAFVSNAGVANGFNSPTSSLSRLDFGTSLLNMPVGTNLGNPGNMLRSARDVTIYKSCNEIVGYVVNYSTVNHLVRLDFNNSLTSAPLATSLGNTGNLNFPHSISRLFRMENDLYSFITNLNTSSVTRLKFTGCSSASMLSSTTQNPPAITYSSPGTYNINLTIDDGLSTQSSFCKQIIVRGNTHTPVQNKSFCDGDSILLTSSKNSGNLWSNGSTNNSIYVKTGGSYWVQSSSGGCPNVDSFIVTAKTLPVVMIGADKFLCSSDTLLLDAGNTGASYLWQDGQTTQKFVVRNEGVYHVTVTKDGCVGGDSIIISNLQSPLITLSDDTTICKTGTAVLTGSGGGIYFWAPRNGLSDSTNPIITAVPDTTTKYYLTVTANNGCKSKDSVTITVIPKPVFGVQVGRPILCEGDTALLSASGGSRYTWSPSSTLSNPFSNSTQAFPQSTTLYKVFIEDATCNLQDSLFINLPVIDKPAIAITKSNDINCFVAHTLLDAGSGNKYLWQPSIWLSDSTSRNPIASPSASMVYYAFVTTSSGCVISDSITVNVNKKDDGSGSFVPTAFTPNNDGKNDCFGVKQWGDVKDFSLNLYNRWGELIFRADNPSKCWDGFYKGVLQPNGVYVYWVKAKTLCGDVFRKGSFVLIR